MTLHQLFRTAWVVRALSVVAILSGGLAFPSLARAEPEGLRRRWVNGDSANGLHRLFVENRLVGCATVDGFPKAAAGGGDVDGESAVLWNRGQRGDAAAHLSRSDVAGAQTGDGIGAELNLLGE